MAAPRWRWRQPMAHPMPWPYLVLALTCLLAGVHAQDATTFSQDCAVLEPVYTQSGMAVPWTGGNCCGFSANAPDQSIYCLNGRIDTITWKGVPLRGELPASFSSLDQLISIDIENTMLTGNLPDPVNMKVLELYLIFGNQFTGEAPSTLGSLPKITNILIQNNTLTGNVPDLSKLTTLQQLVIYSNNMNGNVDGRLPQSLTSCQFCVPGPNSLYTCNQTIPAICSKLNSYCLKTSGPDCPAAGTNQQSQSQGAAATTSRALATAPPPSATNAAVTPNANAPAPSALAAPPSSVPLIAGAVGGVVLALLVVGVAAWVVIRRKKQKELDQAKSNGVGDGVALAPTYAYPYPPPTGMTYPAQPGAPTPYPPPPVAAGYPPAGYPPPPPIYPPPPMEPPPEMMYASGTVMPNTLPGSGKQRGTESVRSEDTAAEEGDGAHWFFLRFAAPLGLVDQVSVPYPGREPIPVDVDYTPTSDDEIALVRGHFVQVRAVFRDGWASGENVGTGEYGMVPLMSSTRSNSFFRICRVCFPPFRVHAWLGLWWSVHAPPRSLLVCRIQACPERYHERNASGRGERVCTTCS
ncbi:hypothetical protein M427DRAFT_351250 [Gonapodya prolifera JEL478]|uniref:SH3 domain-containing protein n=1 Tax=Gonapodya prolifera (strain JEL478) TaxID=1344416 RepID=A0A139AX61_GONPJ|nr:hypothetical protein M427DRAFT_351250 [Gonapodya prolifera JEL478]|eukprot:KXS21055.1 hypothetical protein M427DRAFT_351250 [Gonapodya prolifera JEL478]